MDRSLLCSYVLSFDLLVFTIQLLLSELILSQHCLIRDLSVYLMNLLTDMSHPEDSRSNCITQVSLQLKFVYLVIPLNFCRCEWLR